jgi:Arginase family
VDGMVVSHLAGRGAAELVRFWGEPPLVREPDLALFGVARLDPPEEQLLANSPLRRYLAADVQRMGPAAAAHAAIDRIRGNGYQFVLHFDVDVIADFSATDYPGSGGLSLAEVREALLVFVQQPELAAFEVTAYNPVKDPDGSGAKLIIGLLTELLEARLKTLQAAEAAQAPPPVAAAAAAGRNATPSPEKSASAPDSTPIAAPGEAWSSDSLDLESDTATSDRAPEAPEDSGTSHAPEADDTSDSGEESSGSHS